MIKIRFILMFKGTCEYDYYVDGVKPELHEKISIDAKKDFLHYDIEFIQHFFNEKGEFLYVMVTGFRKN